MVKGGESTIALKSAPRDPTRLKRIFMTVRVLIIAGSDRRQYNCPGVDSKARTLMLRMKSLLPNDVEVDIEDLGNVYGRSRIQSCNACVSTSMALCVWPCNCYEKNDKKEPDLMWDLDLYRRLERADAWAILGPANWYGPTSNLKLLFDRLVCASGGNPREDLIEHKNPELAMALEKDPSWEELSQNHLEGRTAGFFCYGDGGGTELDSQGIPKKLEHKEYFNPAEEPKDSRDIYAPLVWQCRYSGIEVPDHLWHYELFGDKAVYSENQSEDMVKNEKLMASFDAWVAAFSTFVTNKGKIPVNAFSIQKYKTPSHRWADLKLGWRSLRMRTGLAPEGSSPQIQEDKDLNDDAVLFPKKSEHDHHP